MSASYCPQILCDIVISWSEPSPRLLYLKQIAKLFCLMCCKRQLFRRRYNFSSVTGALKGSFESALDSISNMFIQAF